MPLEWVHLEVPVGTTLHNINQAGMGSKGRRHGAPPNRHHHLCKITHRLCPGARARPCLCQACRHRAHLGGTPLVLHQATHMGNRLQHRLAHPLMRMASRPPVACHIVRVRASTAKAWAVGTPA